MKTKRKEIKKEPECNCKNIRQIWLNMNAAKIDIYDLEKFQADQAAMEEFDGLGVS